MRLFLLKMNISPFSYSNGFSNHPLPFDTSALCQIPVSRHWVSLEVEGAGTAGVREREGGGGDDEGDEGGAAKEIGKGGDAGMAIVNE